MQRRESLPTKLPQISIRKKNKMVQTCRKFEDQMQAIEEKEFDNYDMMNKLEHLFGNKNKSFSTSKLLQNARETQKNKLYQPNKDQFSKKQIISQISPVKQKFIRSTNELKFNDDDEKYNKVLKAKLPETIVSINTPSRLNLRELVETQMKGDVTTQMKKRKKSAVAIKIVRQKQLLPYYSTQDHKLIELPFTKISESPDKSKIKVRLSNGTIKQVGHNTIYYKVGEEEQRKQAKLQKEESLEMQMLIKQSKMNVDHILLTRIMQKAGKGIPQTRKAQLMENLIENYKMSVNYFDHNCMRPGWLNNKIKQSNKLSVSNQVIANLQNKLVCSDMLEFLNVYELSRNKYIPLLVEAENKVREIGEFIHFDIFQLITILHDQKQTKYKQEDISLYNQEESQKQQTAIKKQKQKQKVVIQNSAVFDPAQHYRLSKQITNLNLEENLQNKKSHIDLKIFEMESHLDKLKKTIQKDVEHVIKLNPRLVGTPYQAYIKNFLQKFTKFLSIALRSTLSDSVYEQIRTLAQFYFKYFKIQYNGIIGVQQPPTSFYSQIRKINKPYVTPFTKTKILHGPILIMLDLKMKKLRRKNLRNVYKFLLDSRAQIRAYPQKLFEDTGSKLGHGHSERKQYVNPVVMNKQRIYFDNCQQILNTNLVNPIQKYIENYLSLSENINGCINNMNINLHLYGEMEKFKVKIKELSNEIEREVIAKYQEYFSYWELYLLEKPYIDQVISLFKRINGIRLMQDEMKYLEQDLIIIRSFPNIIEDTVVRIDISNIKYLIISTIKLNMNKIGKASEEVLQRLLSIGHTETQKAKKLNQITPYSTIAQYINFAKALSQRGVQKSIERVALNAVVLTENWNFLEQHNFPIKGKIMQQYMESCIWVRMLRIAANANKAKLIVDPQIFSNGIVEKKHKIYYKYMFLVKEILEIVRLSEIAQWDRYAVLTKNIHTDLRQIVQIARDIQQEEELIRIQYYEPTNKQIQNEQKRSEQKPQVSRQVVPKNEKHHKTDSKLIASKQKAGQQIKLKNKAIYKQNFTFFFKQEAYMSRFALFWQYVLKFKNKVEDAGRLTLYEVHGEHLLKAVREGQQVLYELKITSVNKRLLGLVQKLNKEMEPFVKNVRIIKVVCSGSENARTRAISELRKQLQNYATKRKTQISEKRKKLQDEKDKQAELYQKSQAILNALGDEGDQNKIQKQKQQIVKADPVIDQDNFEMDNIGKIESFLSLEQMHITLTQLLEVPFPTLDFIPFYQMYAAQRKKQEVLSKIKQISTYVKSIEMRVQTYQISYPIQPIEIVLIPDSFLNSMQAHNQEISDIVEEVNADLRVQLNSNVVQIYDEYLKDLQQCSKKLFIFVASLYRMKKMQPEIETIYCCFELLLPQLLPVSQDLIVQYRPIYEQFRLEYSKKLQVLKKLSYTHLYQDRVRISYDEELIKFEELKIKIFNHPTFGMRALSSNHNFIGHFSLEHFFNYLLQLPTSMTEAEYDRKQNVKFDEAVKKISKNYYEKQVQIKHFLPSGWTNLTFTISYEDKDRDFVVSPTRLKTVHNETINLQPSQLDKSSNKKVLKLWQRLFKIEMLSPNKKQQSGENQTATLYECKCGILQIICQLNDLVNTTIRVQTMELIHLIYEHHYNIKQIFLTYISLKECFFQSLMAALQAVFYMDLLLVWENDYDIMLLRDKIRECYEIGFVSKESQNNELIQQIYNFYQLMIGTIDLIARRRYSENDRDLEGADIDIEKIRKKLIIQFLPIMILKGFDSEENKKLNRDWLFALKKTKQDDFINETHLNPVFIKIISSLNRQWQNCKRIYDKLEFKEIQKKDEIEITKINQSLYRDLILHSQPKKSIKIQSDSIKQQADLEHYISITGQNNFRLDYKFQITNFKRSHFDKVEHAMSATMMVTEAVRHNKLLVTNYHPNCALLGRNIKKCFVKIPKNNQSSKLPDAYSQSLMKRVQKREKQKAQQLIKNGPNSNNSNENLRTSLMSGVSLQTPRARKQSQSFGVKGLIKVADTKIKSVASVNLHEFSQSVDYMHIKHLQKTQGLMLENYNKQMLDDLLNIQNIDFCIHVEDHDSMAWVIDYLTERKISKCNEFRRQTNKTINSQQILGTKHSSPNIIYIYCFNLNVKEFLQHPQVQQCLLYINASHESYSNAMLNPNYAQKVFTHANDIKKGEHSKTQKKIKQLIQVQALPVQPTQSFYMPLPTHIHSNSLFEKFENLYPYCTKPGNKIYVNSLITPPSINQASSPNLCRNPMNPKFRELALKCIAKYYSWLKAEQFLEIPHLEPIVHALHYNTFVAQSSRINAQGNIQHCTKYIIEHQISRVMKPVWALVMKQIYKLQMGQSGINFDVEQAIKSYRTYLYVVPAHAMTIGQLLGSMPVTLAAGKNIIGNHYKRVQKGVIQQIVELAIMASNLTMGNKNPSSLNSPQNLHKHDFNLNNLQQYMLPDSELLNSSSSSSSLNASRWFILDLSVVNSTSIFIYKWLCSSFMHSCFVFMNQHSLHWDHDTPLRIACAMKQMFSSSHNSSVNNLHLVKIMILAHPDLINIHNSNPLSKVKILPQLDLISNFNPMFQMTVKLLSILSVLGKGSASLPDIQQVMCIFKKLMFEPQIPAASLFYSKWTPRRQQIFLTRLSIMVNELRKARLANGMYTQDEISEKQSKNVFLCSIELRERIKSSYHLMLQLQEIQKNLDTERKQMYRQYTSTFNLIFNSNNSNEQKQMTFNPTYISLEQLKSYLQDNHLTKQSETALIECLKVLNQKLIPDIGLDIVAKIIVQALYDTLVTDGENSHSVSEWLISAFSNQTTNMPVAQVAKKKASKISRKGRQANANINISLNHPNLLGLPTISHSAVNPYPTPFSLVEYSYNIALDAWLLSHEHSLASVWPNKTNCSASRSKLSLHPAEILRLNPSLNGNSKQSVLKVYCQATNIKYEPPVIRVRTREQDIWRRYLCVYGQVTTIISCRHSHESTTQCDLSELLCSIKQSDLQFVVDMQDHNTTTQVQAYLRSKYSPLCDYGLLRPKVHQLNRSLYSSTTNIDISANLVWKHKTQISKQNYIDKVILIDLVLPQGQTLSQQVKRQVTNRYGHSTTIYVSPSLEVTQKTIKHKTTSQVIQLYMKYKNIANVSELLITPNSTSASKKKAKEKVEHKHHSEEALSQDTINLFLSLKQVHLDRLIALTYCYNHPKIYPFVLEVTLNMSVQPQNRYSCELDAYGIHVKHDAGKLIQIYRQIVEMNRHQKLMRNQLAMGNNESIPGGSTDIEDYKNKMLQSIGKYVFHYITDACIQLKIDSSQFYDFTCRYLLPKPRKYKLSSMPFVGSSSQPFLRLNNSFAQLIPLSALQIKENTEQQIDLQLNQNYKNHIYCRSHSLAALFQLHQHVIVSVVRDKFTQIGRINVQQYIAGFLLFTKARIFVHSQTVNDTNLVEGEQRNNKNMLNSTNINESVLAYGKQFSLLDTKVDKIIHEYWRLMHRPKIKVVYTCLHCEMDEFFIDEPQWGLLLDVDNERKIIFQKHEQQKLNESPNKFYKKKWHRSKTYGNKPNINSSQISSQSIATIRDDEVMGVLHFVEVVNPHIKISKIRQHYQKQQRGKGKCNQCVIILAHNKQQGMPIKIKENDRANQIIQNKRLQLELEGALWITHKEQNKLKEPDQQIKQRLPSYLDGITKQKEQILYDMLSNFQRERMNNVYIPTSMIGKQYTPAILKKRQQLKDIVLNKKEEQASKKQVYDNCALDIQTLNNKIEEAEDVTKDVLIKLAAWNKEISELSSRLNFYIGESEFIEVKNKILAIPRKSIEKEVLKAAYIEDNPFNLSFIYRFNVLADSTYFPDKNFEVYEHEYHIGSKYSVFEEQKKQFIKLVNMGRLNVMLENDDYWPNEDQIISTERLRKQFSYLTPIDKASQSNQQFSKENPYSLNILIHNEIEFIKQHAQTQAQFCFHIYICLLSAHSYVRHQLSSNKQRLTKSIKNGEEECKILSNKIRDSKLTLKQQEDKLVIHKSKMERAAEEVKICQNNQQIFAQIAQANTIKLQKLLQQSLFGISQEQREVVLREICKFVVNELSQKCQQCSQSARDQQLQFPLSIEARRYLFYLVSIPTIKNSILTYKTSTVSSLYCGIYQYLLEQCLKLSTNMNTLDCGHLKEQSYLSKIDYRKYNIVVHSQANTQHALQSEQLLKILTKAVFPQLINEPKLLLQKLERIEAALETNLQKFVEKVELVQAKDIQSIRRFQITEETTSTIMQGYRNACLQFQGMDYLGDWAKKNKLGIVACKSIVQRILDTQTKQNLRKLNPSEVELTKHCSEVSLAYYCRLIGEIIQRGNHMQNIISDPAKVSKFVDALLRQFVYQHSDLSSRPIANQLQIKSIVNPLEEKSLYKQSIDSLIQSKSLINECSLLDNIMCLKQQIIFIEASEILHALLVSKVQKGNFKIVNKEITFNGNKSESNKVSRKQSNSSQIEGNQQQQQDSISQQCNNISSQRSIYNFFEPIDDTTPQHWVVFMLHVHYFSSLNCIKQSIYLLKQKILESQQQNTKYMFVVDGELKRYTQQKIQPVYSIYASHHIAAVLKSYVLNDQLKKRQYDHSIKGICEELIGKMFDYYSSRAVHEGHNYLRLFTSPLQAAATDQSNTILRAPYSRLESIPAMYKFSQLSSITVSSSLEYRILKKIMTSLKYSDNDIQTYEIVQGYLIFKVYHGATIEKYPRQIVKAAVESVAKGGFIEQEHDEQNEEIIQLNKVKNRFYKFVLFLQKLHEQLFIDPFLTAEHKKQHKNFSTKQNFSMLIEQNLLTDLHLSQNKMRYSIKNRDATQQIVKNLFNKTNSKSKSASKHSFSQSDLARDTDMLLADPKIYVILNKTFKRAINKVAALKFNKKNNLMAKQVRHRKRTFTNFHEVDQLWQHQWFTNIWNKATGLHKAQFLMWAYSEVQAIKMNNIYFAVKPKSLNLLDIPTCDQHVEGQTPKQNFQTTLQFQLFCVKSQELLLSGVKDSHESCKIQLQVMPRQIDQKTMKFYRGLLFRYQGHFETETQEGQKLQESVTFKDMSAVKQDEFLKPVIASVQKEESIQALSPTISRDTGQPVSPMQEKKLTRRLSLNKAVNMRQSNQLGKMNYFVLPIYCCNAQIGVLQIDIKLCKGFDQVRTFAVIK